MDKLLKTTCLLLSLLILITSAASAFSFVSAATPTMAYINAEKVNIREDASTNSKSLTQVSKVYVNIIGTKTGSDGKLWYHITYNEFTGYIRGDSWFELIEPAPVNPDFEEQLKSFPESYRKPLRQLHALYPNWVFYPDNLSLTFDEAVALETPAQVKQVQGDTTKSWLSMVSGTYDWSSGKYVTTNGGWYTASREVIQYYMDPRNFLNSEDIYMFMQQSYNPQYQTEAGLADIIKGTFLEKGYSESGDPYGGSYTKLIMAAAQESGVSPYILASTIIMEQGVNGGTPLISGNYSGYEGLYNFFNVGASGATSSAVIQNGLSRAKSEGWTTRVKSIKGGANFVGKNYIGAGQDTYFYMNYNIKINKISHQYAQAVHNAYSSGRRLKDVYSDKRDIPIEFKIPVYKSIPLNNAELPAKNSLQNNYYFTSVTAEGLTPSFTMYRYNYDLKAEGNIIIKVAVPAGASYAGASSFDLKVGNNKITLPVRSATGYVNNYTVDVNATVNCILYIDTGSEADIPDTPTVTTDLKGDTNGDGNINGRDLANVQMHILNVRALTGNALANADTNKDGVVNGRDLANIQMHILNVRLLN